MNIDIFQLLASILDFDGHTLPYILYCMSSCNRWLFGFLRKGYNRTLTEDDIFEVLPSQKTTLLMANVNRCV